ncbi:hypothetical protein ES703_02315 [subsurface metagenome]
MALVIHRHIADRSGGYQCVKFTGYDKGKRLRTCRYVVCMDANLPLPGFRGIHEDVLDRVFGVKIAAFHRNVITEVIAAIHLARRRYNFQIKIVHQGWKGIQLARIVCPVQGDSNRFAVAGYIHFAEELVTCRQSFIEVHDGKFA